MTVRVLHHKSLEAIFAEEGLNLEALKEDFKQYKEFTSRLVTLGEMPSTITLIHYLVFARKRLLMSPKRA